jgi:hypothetical protein
MKKLLLFAWLLMLSIVAMAQGIVVVDKQGNRICYSSGEVSSVEFTTNPPGFIVNKYADAKQYIFDKVQSVKGLPNYLLNYPDTVYVGANGGGFSFEVKANVEYDANPSHRWITFVGQEGDKQKYSASGNDGKWRKGYIAFVSKDQQLTDTLWVLQAGKADPDITYIDYEMYSLKSVTPDQDIYVGFISGGGGGSGNVVIPQSGYKARFQLTHTEGIFWHPVAGDIINLEAEKGTCTPTIANTDAEGQVEVEFFPQSLTIDKGTVKATNSQVFNSGESWRGEATVTFSFKDVYQFECLTPQQDVPKGEESAVKFKLMRYANGGWRPAANATVTAKLDKATFGGSTDITTVTNIDGEATIRFVPDDIMPCVGSVVATCEVTLGDGRHATSTQTAEFAVAEEFKIEAAVPKIYSENSETNTIRFTIYEKNGGQWVKNPHDVEVTYSAVNGKLSRNKETVKDDASVDFTPDASFSDTNPGSVTASCSILLSNGKTWTGDATTNVLFENQYRLDCSDPQFIAPDGETPVEFRLMRNVNGQWEPFAGQDIAFAVAPGGTCSPGIVKTDAEGKAVTNFKMMDGFTTSSLRAGYSVVDADGITHSGSKTANLVLLKYKMRADYDEVYIDGTNDYRSYFYLFEYINGEWKGCEKEIPATFKATGGTVDKNEPFDRGISIVTFHPEKDFKEGSVTAQCDIELDGGFVWHGEAVTKLVKEEQYKIERVQPEENETEIAWDETKTVKFRVLKKEDSGYQPVHLANVYFDCVDGECSLDRELTDEEGIASTLFTLETDKSEGSIKATYHILDGNGIWHYGSETANFIIPLYKLEATNAKVAVKNDGSEQKCWFNLYEYQDGNWEMCKKEVEINFEAVGVTLSKSSDKYNGYGVTAAFVVGKDFTEGSVTAKCDIELEDGRVWHGDATAELILDDYQFSRVLPEDDITEIYPDESQDVVFSLSKQVNGTYQPCKGQVVDFNSQQGTFSSPIVHTDDMGKATTKFTINKDKSTAEVYAHCVFDDEQGIRHDYVEKVEFYVIPYKLEATNAKVAVKNDGSEQKCWFNLYEYQDGKWEECKKEVEINFEAVGVTLSKSSAKYIGYGATAAFVVGKDFTEGSVTAKCDILLEDGRTWHGDATVELILDDYQFSRVLPENNPAGIYPDESQNVTFSLMKLVNGTYQPCKGQVVDFNSQQGTFSSPIVHTDGMGKATTKFTINKDKSTASVYAHCTFDDEQGIRHDYVENVEFYVTPYKLKCLTPEVEMKTSEEHATIRYELLEYKKGEWVACPDKKLLFTATNGSAQPDYALTNENGICQTVFTPTEDATEGTVTGTCTIVVNEKANFVWTQSQTAHITIIDDIGINDEILKKVAKKKPNEYIIRNKRTGAEEIRNYTEKWSEWTKGKDVLEFVLEDADDDGGTKGMIYGFIPKSLVNQILFLNAKQFENTPGAKFGFGVYEGQELSADFMSTTGMTEGNIKPLSRFMLRMIKPLVTPARRATSEGAEDEEFTGEYELLYYLEFQNQIWNPETQQMEEGDEYEVYGRGTMKMHIPHVTSFVVDTEKDWVKVGESTKVTIESYYEEEATWDWNDTQLIGSSTDYSKARNGEDEGFFSYDAATQTLTSLKSNDNKYVYVCIGLISNPGVKNVMMVSTGNGWNYTMIKTNHDVIECRANSYPSFDFDWAPKASDSERMDFNALELDPDCVPAGYFSFPTSYANQGWPVWVSSKCAPGEYTLKFRVKSNHNINCTMKFIVSPEE